MYQLYTDPTAHATWGSWHSFLIKWARSYAAKQFLPFDVEQARAKVNVLMRTWKIASVASGSDSGRDAYSYWRACH